MKFTSHFKELKVLVNGQLVHFSNGEFHTDDKTVIDVLKTIKDVTAHEEPKQEVEVETVDKTEEDKPVKKKK